jgi:tetratricopeptide (TPR) repeat protein
VNLPKSISAGEFFDFIRPAILLLAAFISTWVLTSARRRFANWSSLAWALATLFFPLLVLPLYLAARWLLRPAAADNNPQPNQPPRFGRMLIPLVYLSVVLLAICGYLYHDYTTVDAHLARATQAKVKGKRGTAIMEYRAALSKEDDAHTHKLLAVELADAGDWTSALQEFRRAEASGEADDSIAYRIAELLNLLNHPAEAKLEYNRFLNSKACTVDLPDVRCERARTRVLEK